jgi:hypothetical protein
LERKLNAGNKLTVMAPTIDVDGFVRGQKDSLRKGVAASLKLTARPEKVPQNIVWCYTARENNRCIPAQLRLQFSGGYQWYDRGNWL